MEELILVYNYRTVTERDPCLKIGITLAIFRSLGKVLCLMDRLIIYVIYVIGQLDVRCYTLKSLSLSHMNFPLS